MIVIDALVCILVLFFGYNLKNKYLLSKSEKKLLDKIFIFHILVCCIATPILFYGGDANNYWQAPKDMSFIEVWNYVVTSSGRPTSIMFLINFVPSKVLALSFFTGMMLYSIIGYWSFIYFIVILKKIAPYYKFLSKVKVLGISVFPLLLFLPNLHFWSSGIGKDTLLFFAIMLFIYSLLDIRKKIVGLIISFLISFFLRPHITLFLIVGFGLGYALDSRLKIYQKVLVSLAFGIGFFFIFNSVLNFVNLDSFDAESIANFSDNKAKALSNAGSGLDISSYPYPLKVFTFLYRPLFFDVHNAISIVASFENLFLLLVTMKLLINKPFKMLIRANWLIKGTFFFFILGALSFSLILSNLGIMLREKNMFMLAFYIFIFWIFHAGFIMPYIRKKKHGNQNINYR